MDTKLLLRISHDVACGHVPGAGYTPEMEAEYIKMAEELAEAQRLNPKVTLWIPGDGAEGLPDGSEPGPRNDYSEDQPRDEKGRFGSGSGLIDGGGGPRSAGEGKDTYENRVRRNMMVGGKVGSLATNPGQQNHGIPKAEYDRRLGQQAYELRGEEYEKQREADGDPIKLGATLVGQDRLPGVLINPRIGDKDPKIEQREGMKQIAKAVVAQPKPGVFLAYAGKETVEKMVGTSLRKEVMPGSSKYAVPSESSVHESAIEEEHPLALIPEKSIRASEIASKPNPTATRYASQGDDAREDMKARVIITAKNNNPHSESANASFKVTLDDGSKALFKPKDGEEPDLRNSIDPGTYYKREAAFSAVAENLGVGENSPVTVVHTHEDLNGRQTGALQSWIDGTPSREADTVLSKRGSEKMRVADFVTGNTDRHAGNLLITDKGEPGLIDHGLTFPENNRDRWIQPMSAIDKTIGPLEPETHEQIKNINTEKLVKSLMNNGIEPEAIRNTVVRTLNLKEHPEIIERTQAGTHMQAGLWSREVLNNHAIDTYGSQADAIINKIIKEDEGE